LLYVSHFSTPEQQGVDGHDPQPAKKARIDPFADLRDGCCSTTNDVSTPELSGREEMARYKALRVPAGHSSSLVFWRESSKDYPLLSEVARRVLCISASSAQSERDFQFSRSHYKRCSVKSVQKQSRRNGTN